MITITTVTIAVIAVTIAIERRLREGIDISGLL